MHVILRGSYAQAMPPRLTFLCFFRAFFFVLFVYRFFREFVFVVAIFFRPTSPPRGMCRKKGGRHAPRNRARDVPHRVRKEIAAAAVEGGADRVRPQRRGAGSRDERPQEGGNVGQVNKLL